MMLRLMMALQSVSAGAGDIPADFDLKKVKPAPDANAIVVTGRRQSQRVERAPLNTEPPLGRAEFGLFGQAKGNVHVESRSFGNGTTSQRLMVGVKVPF
ncbi:hypothetical protein [Sphingobium sp.]|uniref:hypothetical protein n=1 Tax=Sphingobium sp. TaxID=1912891 RepID=UPI003B3B215F